MSHIFLHTCYKIFWLCNSFFWCGRNKLCFAIHRSTSLDITKKIHLPLLVIIRSKYVKEHFLKRKQINTGFGSHLSLLFRGQRQINCNKHSRQGNVRIVWGNIVCYYPDCVRQPCVLLSALCASALYAIIHDC